MTALRAVLGLIHDCAAPLWCRLRGHELYTIQHEGVPWRYHLCDRCGEEWSERFELGRWVTAMSTKFDRLAVYNAEVHRGIVHTPEYDAEMAELQREFNERSTWHPIGDCGCAEMPNPPHGGGPSRFYCAEHTEWPDITRITKRRRWWQR